MEQEKINWRQVATSLATKLANSEAQNSILQTILEETKQKSVSRKEEK
ncbi:hypothetical protein DLJ48_08645 [Oenococcus sicerae]|uniref:Uncharacterized protein n=1 Tax=Oenococcus sicerae TaxID=2203724 RepID=A0ABX6J571_9LACO|nr:hypothetical protein [Oenococcus sicerae]QHW12505.1 hypothetical protein DLJ48_08645 [Oenococcus sicerae]